MYISELVTYLKMATISKLEVIHYEVKKIKNKKITALPPPKNKTENIFSR